MLSKNNIFSYFIYYYCIKIIKKLILFFFRVNSRKNERYFGKDQSQSFIRFTPGKLSEDLLQALDVPSNGLPLHVYQMRKWGYPNGWLEEAKEKYSGIAIFTAPNECNI